MENTRMKLHPKMLVLTVFMIALPVMGQGGYTLWTDVKLDDRKAASPAPSNLTVILCDQSTKRIRRQTVGRGGRYRFTNLRGGEYDIVIEANSGEITRLRLTITGHPPSDIRQDVEFEW